MVKYKKKTLRIAIAQINPTVWDVDGNIAKIRAHYEEAVKSGAELMITPEMAVTGYPAEDLWLDTDSWAKQQSQIIHELASMTKGHDTGLLVGMPIFKSDLSIGFVRSPQLHNAALIFAKGEEIGRYYKHHLPNYGVFDEARYFRSVELSQQQPLHFAGLKLGVMICEDLWYDDMPKALADAKADIFVVINASPYEPFKRGKRQMLALWATYHHKIPLVYANLVGAQDELLFDGASFTVDKHGTIISAAQAWQEELLITDVPLKVIDKSKHAHHTMLPMEDGEDIYSGLMLALRDYVKKNGFSDVLLGLSGGIDSALVAVLAADALGTDHLHVAMLPSEFTSQASHDDANALISKLGCKHYTASISQLQHLAQDQLKEALHKPITGIAAENLQARLRGLLLMAISNQNHLLLLATGNKSEYAVGYATIYGDMCGGFAPIKDVYKTVVYKLAKWRNKSIPTSSRAPNLKQPIHDNILHKPPTAELKDNQTDQDTLPPYDILDMILSHLIEGDDDATTLTDAGVQPELLAQIKHMLGRAEFKRRQAAVGPKITTRSFGRDWRQPITRYNKK